MDSAPGRRVLLGGMAALCLGGPALAQQALPPAPMANAQPDAQGVEVLVDITDMRNTKGSVMACMTSDPEVFPRCREDPDSYSMTVPAAEAGTLRFANVRPGTYAIALLHDENNNGKADRALSMIPREGFGFSRDARVRLGPPSFSDAAITIGRQPQRQTIRMRYTL